MRFFRLFLVFAFLMPSVVQADGPLRSIVVFGNEKTERKTILEMINVPSQTYVNRRLVQRVDDNLVNSGLFKTVKVRKVNNRDGTADLRITVVEKQLWFIFPIFQAWSGRYSGGLAFGESNLFVPSGRTLFLMQGGNELSRIFAAFEVKDIFDSDFMIRTWALARTDDIPLYVNQSNEKTDEINLKDAAFVVIPGYQWTNDISTSVGVKYRRIKYGDAVGVLQAGEKGHDVSITFEFVADTLRRRDGFLKGYRLRAAYEFAESRFGTDFTYHMQSVEWRQAFDLTRHFNYVVFLRGAIGDELPFHREFTLGGSSLRGYADRQFRGDTLIVASQNILYPIFRFKRFSLFGSVFHELGLLYRDVDTIGRSSLRNGLGGGFRVSLADVLAPVFGMDFAYGIEDQSFRMLFALGLVDF